MRFKVKDAPGPGWMTAAVWAMGMLVRCVEGADSKAPTPMDMLEAVNKFRKEGGKKAVCWSPEAAALAEKYAQTMVGKPINQYLEGPPEVYYSSVKGYLSQNLFQGSINTDSQQPGKAIANGLHNHKTKENLMADTATHMGVGMSTFTKDNDTFYYWVQVFVAGDKPCDPPEPPKSLADSFAKPDEKKEVAPLDPPPTPPPAPPGAPPPPPPPANPDAPPPASPPSPPGAPPGSPPAAPPGATPPPPPPPLNPSQAPPPAPVGQLMMLVPVAPPPPPPAPPSPPPPPPAEKEEPPPVKSRPPETDPEPKPKEVPPPPPSQLPPPADQPPQSGPPPLCPCGAAANPGAPPTNPYPPGSVLERTKVALNTVPRIDQGGLGGAPPPPLEDPSSALPSRYGQRPPV